MEKVVFETEVYAPKEEVYDFLMRFEDYGKYSEHVKNVRVVRRDPLEWEITIKWWKIRYTARSRLTNYVENERIEWEVVKDVRARGVWLLEETEEGTKVKLKVWYEPSDADKVNPLRFVPTSRLISLVKPVVKREGKRVLRRVVSDLEGKPRKVDLKIDGEVEI